MWLISLVGTHVFHDQVNVCVTSDLKNQSKIRDFIKQEYGIESSTDIKSSRDCFSFYRCYSNITDDRNISLVIERISTEEDIISCKKKAF